MEVYLNLYLVETQNEIPKPVWVFLPTTKLTTNQALAVRRIQILFEDYNSFRRSLSSRAECRSRQTRRPGKAFENSRKYTHNRYPY
jgi:hypothetical protein